MTPTARVAFMVTCLGDLYYPEIGEAIVRLLRGLGVAVDLPAGQTCCGLPLFNSGYHADAAAIARRTLGLFTLTRGVHGPGEVHAVFVEQGLRRRRRG